MKSRVNGLDHRLSFKGRNSALRLSFAGKTSFKREEVSLGWQGGILEARGSRDCIVDLWINLRHGSV